MAAAVTGDLDGPAAELTDEDPPLPPQVAELARRIHFSRSPVVPPAEVVFRLRQAGHHDVTAEQVRGAITQPRRWQVITWT